MHRLRCAHRTLNRHRAGLVALVVPLHRRDDRSHDKEVSNGQVKKDRSSTCAEGLGSACVEECDEKPAQRLQDYMLSNRADGLLLLDGSLDLGILQSLVAPPHSVPLVLACEEIPNSGFHMVLTDNQQAAERATRHLIDLGHKRIGHLLGPEPNVVARDRLAGFTRAISQAGLPLRQSWLLRGNFELESGFAAASQFMSLEERPTAVFAANDESAIGFLSGLRQYGVECPRDISVVGFDDLAVAAHYAPPLTTMRQPRELLGRMAAEALIDILEDVEQQRGRLRIVLNSDLIVRESTAYLR